MEEIFEKSVKAMDNVDTIENGSSENSNQITNSSRLSNPSIKKQLKNGKNSTNKTCSIS